MARKLKLAKAMFFFTSPEKRILLTQVEPVCEVPSVLKPHELDQINAAIKRGAIKEVSEDFQAATETTPKVQEPTKQPQSTAKPQKVVARRKLENQITDTPERKVVIKVGEE